MAAASPLLFRAALAATMLVSGCATGGTARRAPAPSPGDYQVSVAGVELRYHVHGNGPVMVVHPGGPGLRSAYLRMPELERFLTLVYLDPVGTGASGRIAPGQYTLQRYASDVEGLRAALGLERFWLLGHSYGGVVAQVYASAYPGRLQGLVLYSTTPRIDAEWMKDMEAKMTARSGEPWFADAMAATGEPKSDAEITAAFQRRAPFYFADYTGRRAEFDPIIARMDATLDPRLPLPAGPDVPFDLRSRLSGIRAQTLVLTGRHDVNCGPRFAEELRQGIAGARVQVFERSGHTAHVEEPQAFAAAVRDFVTAAR